tara:strand:+ start:2384 stop:2965 length:582 start_codon:yes stop_codon:yes gene_type:complete
MNGIMHRQERAEKHDARAITFLHTRSLAARIRLTSVGQIARHRTVSVRRRKEEQNMKTKMMTAIAAGTVLAATISAVPAEAQRRHGGSVSVQGSGGRGGIASRSTTGTVGNGTVTRGVQTNAGYGSTTTRASSTSNGTYNGSTTHTLNNGKTFGRSTTATNNGDGTGSYSSTVTGPNGQSGTVSGTVSTSPEN